MIRKIIGFILVISILIITPILSVIYAAFETYLNPVFYKSPEVIEGIYDSVAGLMEANLEHIIVQEEGLEMIEDIDIMKYMKELITEEDLLSITSEISDQLSQEELPETVVLDISSIEQKLPKVTTRLIAEYVGTWDDCTTSEVTKMESGETPTCIPPGMTESEVKDMINANFNKAPSVGTYEIDLTTMSPETKLALTNIINYNFQIRAAIVLLYLALLGVLSTVIWKPLSSVCTWVASTALWGGIITWLVAMVLGTQIPYVMTSASATTSESEAAILQSLATPITTMLGFITDKMILHATELVFAGIVLLVIGFIIRKKQ